MSHDPSNPYKGRPLNPGPGQQQWQPASGRPHPVPSPPFPVGGAGPFDRSMLYKNAPYTVPPMFAPQIRGYWHTGPVQLQFSNPNVAPLNNAEFGPVDADVTSRAVWQSVLFDLRPDLGGGAANPTQAYPIMRGAAFGGGTHLMVQIAPTAAATDIPDLANTLRVYAVERCHVIDPARADAAGTRSEITAKFYDGLESVLLDFIPPSNPVRYWGLNLIFDWTGVAGTEPALATWAACQ